MDYLILGFLTGLSLILAIGAQNIFVIEQGLKKQYIFLVCLICSISDFLLIFIGIFLFQYLNNYFTPTIELIFNILLLIFLLHFIWGKIRTKVSETSFNVDTKTNNLLGLVSLVVTFPLYWISSMSYGGIGVAIVFCIVQIISTFIFYHLINKKFLNINIINFAKVDKGGGG